MHPSAFSSLPSKLAVSVCCQTVLLWAPSVLCVRSFTCGISILCTWHQGDPSARSLPNRFFFSRLLRTADGCSGRGNGPEQELWSQRKQVVPFCTVQGLQPHPSLLLLDVPELQMDLILQINLNCK